jgi:hypothetical protein
MQDRFPPLKTQAQIDLEERWRKAEEQRMLLDDLVAGLGYIALAAVTVCFALGYLS